MKTDYTKDEYKEVEKLPDALFIRETAIDINRYRKELAKFNLYPVYDNSGERSTITAFRFIWKAGTVQRDYTAADFRNIEEKTSMIYALQLDLFNKLDKHAENVKDEPRRQLAQRIDILAGEINSNLRYLDSFNVVPIFENENSKVIKSFRFDGDVTAKAVNHVLTTLVNVLSKQEELAKMAITYFDRYAYNGETLPNYIKDAVTMAKEFQFVAPARLPLPHTVKIQTPKDYDFLHALRRANVARCEAPNGFNHKLSSWDLNRWLTAVTGELGEAANIVKKINRITDKMNCVKLGQSDNIDELKEMLQDELADVFIYLDLLCAYEGYDIATIVNNKFTKTSLKIGYEMPFIQTKVIDCDNDEHAVNCRCGAKNE